MRIALATVVALVATLIAGALPSAAHAQEPELGNVLLYTGTTGYRHADAINAGRPILERELEEAGYAVDWVDCNGNGSAAGNCDTVNAPVFTDANLAQYDAIFLFNSSWSWAGGGAPGPLFNAEQQAAIIRFVQQGGGIVGNHNATDMGAGQSVWNWWDGDDNSAVGTRMPGHAASSLANVADVQVADHNHLATRDLPDVYEFGDEHYNYARSVRGTHHVLATLDEKSYTPGGNAMGQDHPISWCKLYDGAAVNDGTGVNKPYNDGRVWVSGMGHFGSQYTENGGDNNLIKHLIGGVRWAAGEGKKSDCAGTVWSSFKRTLIVPDAKGPIGLDVAADGKVYWSEIGADPSYPDYESEGYIKMYDPTKPAGNKTTVATIPTRADHNNSEDGVLGMTLENGFDLSDPSKRDVYVYYSPRNAAWPTTGDQTVVGYNQISRFTLNAEGTAVVPGSERKILEVPKAKISGNPAGFPGGPTDNGPGHVGGAGLDFDSEGNLYLGVGDDVSPNANGHGAYAPMDYRAKERWDARKTSANSADLRGKILRITPIDGEIPAEDPGVDKTYTIPAGNMFPQGMAQTRPEIYAMGFRQPFTVQADPANPGTVVVGEYCHDASSNNATRGPAGVCEWDLVDRPAFHGWPFCMGDNSAANSMFRWNYADNESTGQRYDCSGTELPSDIRWAPEGQTAAEPTFDGLDTLPGPAATATVWKKDQAPGNHPADVFGNLGPGGRSPVTGPVYRYDAETAGPGAFPAYYDGSWFIANRGDGSGFWKEVRLREDNNQMLRVNDWAPASVSGSPGSNPVIPSRFGPDGALYLATWHNGCCRNGIQNAPNHQIVKVEFAVQDECLEDTQAPNVNHTVAGREQPGSEGTYLDTATLTLVAGDVGCAGLQSVEYRLAGSTEWERYLQPVEYEPGEYTVEYRATDANDNVSAVKTATFTVVELNDQEAPEVTATVSGEQNDEGHYLSPATVEIDATDALSPIASIEYRVNQEGDWTETEFDGEDLARAISAEVAESGFKYVEFRATDRAGNTSAVGGVAFSVVSGCTYERSDEFNGPLDARWLRHTRNGGTPTDGPLAPTVANGKLSLPTHNFEIDAANATTSVGPINFLAQDLPSLGDSWTVETQLTVTHTGGWQGVGLMLWQADNNFFRSTITHSLSAGNIYVEQSKDNPSTAEGSRAQAGGNVTIRPDKGAVTIRMRYVRENGARTVRAQYRIVDGATPSADWVNFPGAADFLNLDQAGTPRDGAGSRIGVYAGGNFPGTTGTHPYNGTPADVKVDYFRVTPDEVVSCPEEDVTPPATTATLDPEEPGAGGTYGGPVTVNFSATDESGVSETEFSVNGGDWQTATNEGSDDPFLSSVKVTREGDYTVRYRSRDAEGNLSAPESIAFTLAEIRDVFALGNSWEPDALSVDYGETVTWHWEDPPAQPHNVALVAPDSADRSKPALITEAAVPPGSAPATYTFRKAGTWEFVCTLHSTFDAASGEWSGMVGTVEVGEGEDPPPGPGPVDPGPGGTGDPSPNPNPGPGVNPFPTTTDVALGKLPRKAKLASFLKRGFRVASACESGTRGQVRLRISRKQARKLKLGRKTTLASARVTCGASDTVAVRVKASKRVKKKLAKVRGTVKVKVTITMGTDSDTHTLSLQGKKKKRR